MDDSFHYLSMINHMIVQKKLMEQLKDTGLTLGQPKVLDYLKDHDGASQKEIAAGCLIEAGSLTSILNRMEEKDLIERKMLNGNRRTFHIFMTESGKKIHHQYNYFSSNLYRYTEIQNQSYINDYTLRSGRVPALLRIGRLRYICYNITVCSFKVNDSQIRIKCGKMIIRNLRSCITDH